MAGSNAGGGACGNERQGAWEDDAVGTGAVWKTSQKEEQEGQEEEGQEGQVKVDHFYAGAERRCSQAKL